MSQGMRHKQVVPVAVCRIGCERRINLHRVLRFSTAILCPGPDFEERVAPDE
jgi:hypothetical protein